MNNIYFFSFLVKFILNVCPSLTFYRSIILGVLPTARISQGSNVCTWFLENGSNKSGIYQVAADGTDIISIFCDQTNQGGGNKANRFTSLLSKWFLYRTQNPGITLLQSSSYRKILVYEWAPKWKRKGEALEKRENYFKQFMAKKQVASSRKSGFIIPMVCKLIRFG